MEWRNFRPEHSGTVRAIGYDVKTRELQIRFASGGLYSYADVPKEIADGFLNSSSKGGYVAGVIIKNGYKCTCLERAPKKEGEEKKRGRPRKEPTSI